MKKNDSIESYAQTFRGMNIAIAMFTFMCLCSTYKDYVSDAEKVAKVHEEIVILC